MHSFFGHMTMIMNSTILFLFGLSLQFIVHSLTPKLLWHVSCLFLKFGQSILVRVLMLNF